MVNSVPFANSLGELMSSMTISSAFTIIWLGSVTENVTIGLAACVFVVSTIFKPSVIATRIEPSPPGVTLSPFIKHDTISAFSAAFICKGFSLLLFNSKLFTPFVKVICVPRPALVAALTLLALSTSIVTLQRASVENIFSIFAEAENILATSKRTIRK